MAPKLYRRCLSCQRLAHKSEFLRIVRVYSTTGEPSQRVQVDGGMGRSAYICSRVECLQQAQKKNRLGRSLRIQIPPEIFAQLQARLTASNQQQLTTDEQKIVNNEQLISNS